MHQARTAEERRNEDVIRELYALAEAKSKDTAKFISLFGQSGYFYDVAAGKKYYEQDIGITVDVYASTFPDMHRELYNLYFNDDVVVVELSLNGTHKGDLPVGNGVIPPTNKEMHAPCCDVFHLKDGKVESFHCYVAVPIFTFTARRVRESERGDQTMMSAVCPFRRSRNSIFKTRVAALAGRLIVTLMSDRALWQTNAQRKQVMAPTISTLLTRNLHDVFGENDAARRRTAINEIFTEDCVFYDPMGGVYRGRNEIDRIAGTLRTSHAEFRYQPIGEPEEVGNAGRVRWVEGPPGSPPALAGTDFIIVRDGRIAAIYLFFDELP